jgi:hypothetical protein
MCASSNVGGKSGWRLPNRTELSILYNNKNSIGGFASSTYWSSESAGMQESYSNRYYNQYVVNFASGAVSTAYYRRDVERYWGEGIYYWEIYDDQGSSCHCRCVRTLP